MFVLVKKKEKQSESEGEPRLRYGEKERKLCGGDLWGRWGLCGKG